MREYKINTERKSIKEKAEKAKSLEQNLKGFKSFLLVDLRKVPDELLQGMRSKLRKKGAFLKVSNMVVLKKALSALKLPEQFFNSVSFPIMVVGINETPYSVANFFSQSYLKQSAKAGDIAEEEIIIPEGETSLLPGPALSQLKNAGINAKVDKGKIAVAKDSIIAKKGEKITAEKASALQLLEIKPFKVGMKISKAYDGQTLFEQDVLLITFEDIEQEIKAISRNAFALSYNAKYPTQDNVKMFVNKAYSQAKGVAVNSHYPSEAFIKDLISKALLQGKSINV